MDNSFEMGGYLPLELTYNQLPWELFDASGVFEVNTGRTALWCAVNSLDVQSLYVPSFYCPDVLKVLEEMNIEIIYYKITDSLLPESLPEKTNSAILLVNYYGVITKEINRITDSFEKVIIDNSHAFFSPPVFRKGVLNIYSCRKFIGVSDGALLIGDDLHRIHLEEDSSYSRANFLLKAYETGTDGAYADSKNNEKNLTGFFLMSRLTKRILRGVDFDYIKRRRIENFRCLHKNLAHIQKLSCIEEESIPYMYPLLLDKDIHKKLVSEKIYVPYLWSPMLDSAWDGTTEQYLSRYIIPLPVDQRYTENDMERMLEFIHAAYNEKEV